MQRAVAALAAGGLVVVVDDPDVRTRATGDGRGGGHRGAHGLLVRHTTGILCAR
jgi:hypothetical protein